MRKYLLAVAAVGLLSFTSISSSFAQAVTVEQAAVTAAQNEAIAACTAGTPAACQAALALLEVAITRLGLTGPALSAAVLVSFRVVSAAVRSSSGVNAVNIATIDARFSQSFPERNDRPSASPT